MRSGTCAWGANDGAALGRVGRLAAFCLMPLACGAVPFLLMADYAEAWQWGRLFALLCLALLSLIVLRAETIALWRRIEAAPLLKNHCNWLRLSLVTAVLVLVVGTADMAFCGRFPVLPYAGAVVLNSLLLILLTAVVFALTNRFAFSVGVVYSAYLLAFVANVLKMHYLQAIIRPLDIQYLAAFRQYFTLFFGTGTAVAAAAGVAVWIGFIAVLWRMGSYRVGLARRGLLAAIALAGLAGLMCVDKVPAVRTALKWADMHKNLSNGAYSARRRGFLFEFYSDIPDSIPRPPAGYSAAAVARAVREHFPRSAPGAVPIERGEDVNIVFYLMESFVDPADLHIRFTADPIPNFHAATAENTHGHAIVPNECYGSVNTEFELLSGMSCTFLPKGACSYVQIVKREIPTFPGFLQTQGYKTLAVHAGPPILYSRLQVYPYFHIDRTVWLAKKEEGRKVPLDIAGRWPADKAVVDAIIDISKTHRRYFVFAFPTCTHSPYDYDHYRDSDLDVSQPMPDAARKELKTYINALRTADAALGTLLNHFRRSSQKTIVVVLGDHLPPFSDPEIYRSAGLSAESQAAGSLSRRQVPLLVWSNFLAKEPNLVCSTNFLCTYVLSKAGIAPGGFLALNEALRSRLSILSSGCLATTDGTPLEWDAAGPPLAHLLEDYRLLQYDALLGTQYSASR